MGAGLYMYDVVVKKFTFAISTPDEFLWGLAAGGSPRDLRVIADFGSARIGISWRTKL